MMVILAFVRFLVNLCHSLIYAVLLSYGTFYDALSWLRMGMRKVFKVLYLAFSVYCFLIRQDKVQKWVSCQLLRISILNVFSGKGKWSLGNLVLQTESWLELYVIPEQPVWHFKTLSLDVSFNYVSNYPKYLCIISFPMYSYYNKCL